MPADWAGAMCICSTQPWTNHWAADRQAVVSLAGDSRSRSIGTLGVFCSLTHALYAASASLRPWDRAVAWFRLKYARCPAVHGFCRPTQIGNRSQPMATTLLTQ